MSKIALLSHTDSAAIVARRRGEPISVEQFLAHASHLANILPDTEHVVLGCRDRYRFAVGFAACLISGRVSLLPPSHVAGALRSLAEFAPDAVLLGDESCPGPTLPSMPFPDLPAPALARGTERREIPCIDADQLAAWVFTSGSTGTPRHHPKHWGSLKRNVAHEARALGLSPECPATLLGTVPPQHMYGLESTLLLAFEIGGAFDAGRPFFPADIVATLAASPPPTVLVTTPFHLHTILESGLHLPAIELVLCATAPLGSALAERAEAGFGAPLVEIYGSTETGQLAFRRTTRETAWTLFPEVRLEERSGQTWAAGGHVEVALPLGDIIDQLDDSRFELRGRHTDLVNIAGKRSSLGWLNQQLLAVPGVRDGGFFLPDGPAGCPDAAVTRLAAFVVAPDLDGERVLAALREHVDAIFLPRPLVFVDSLPRDAVGKLTRAACESLLARHGSNMRGSA